MKKMPTDFSNLHVWEKINIPWIYIFLLLALKNSNKELIPKSVHYDSCFCIVILAFFFTNMNIADFTTPKLAKSCWTKPYLDYKLSSDQIFAKVM